MVTVTLGEAVGETDVVIEGVPEPDFEGVGLGDPEPVVEIVGDVVTVTLGEAVAEFERD